MALAFVLSLIASAILIAFPQVLHPDSVVKGLDRFLPCIIFAMPWSDVSLAALAYRLNNKAPVPARAAAEPWTNSIAALWLSSEERRRSTEGSIRDEYRRVANQ